MFRRRAPATEQRPRQLQIADLRRLHPSIICHPDGKSFDLPVHTSTTRFLLLIRLPDEFPVLPPNMTVSVVGIAHRLLQGSTVIHPQLSSGWNPQTPLGGLVQTIVVEFAQNPPSILAEMAATRPPPPSQHLTADSDNAMHHSAVALPPIPQEIEELKRLSSEQLSRLITDEVALDEFVQKLPLWTSILSLRKSIEEDVSNVANEHLKLRKTVDQVQKEINDLQAEIRLDLDKWAIVHKRQQEIFLQSSPSTVAALLQEKADRVDNISEELYAQYIAGSVPEDDFLKQYRLGRCHYHRLMVYFERLLNRR